jgi:hypothetical protein
LIGGATCYLRAVHCVGVLTVAKNVNETARILSCYDTVRTARARDMIAVDNNYTAIFTHAFSGAYDVP